MVVIQMLFFKNFFSLKKVVSSLSRVTVTYTVKTSYVLWKISFPVCHGSGEESKPSSPWSHVGRGAKPEQTETNRSHFS